MASGGTMPCMRPVLIPVLAGWLLGIVTVLTIPELRTERTMLASSGASIDVRLLNDYSADGWIVTNASPDRYYVLERPRFRFH